MLTSCDLTQAMLDSFWGQSLAAIVNVFYLLVRSVLASQDGEQSISQDLHIFSFGNCFLCTNSRVKEQEQVGLVEAFSFGRPFLLVGL